MPTPRKKKKSPNIFTYEKKDIHFSYYCHFSLSAINGADDKNALGEQKMDIRR